MSTLDPRKVPWGYGFILNIKGSARRSCVRTENNFWTKSDSFGTSAKYRANYEDLKPIEWKSGTWMFSMPIMKVGFIGSRRSA
jgi:hypothetical protein